MCDTPAFKCSQGGSDFKVYKVTAQQNWGCEVTPLIGGNPTLTFDCQSVLVCESGAGSCATGTYENEVLSFDWSGGPRTCSKSSL